ncbi:unnamed protein product [Phaeothamnion confervicola]
MTVGRPPKKRARQEGRGRAGLHLDRTNLSASRATGLIGHKEHGHLLAFLYGFGDLLPIEGPAIVAAIFGNDQPHGRRVGEKRMLMHGGAACVGPGFGGGGAFGELSVAAEAREAVKVGVARGCLALGCLVRSGAHDHVEHMILAHSHTRRGMALLLAATQQQQPLPPHQQGQAIGAGGKSRGAGGGGSGSGKEAAAALAWQRRAGNAKNAGGVALMEAANPAATSAARQKGSSEAAAWHFADGAPEETEALLCVFHIIESFYFSATGDETSHHEASMSAMDLFVAASASLSHATRDRLLPILQYLFFDLKWRQGSHTTQEVLLVRLLCQYLDVPFLFSFVTLTHARCFEDFTIAESAGPHSGGWLVPIFIRRTDPLWRILSFRCC